MSGSAPAQLVPDQASLLGPGIAGLFIQGIESGLVLAQFSQWLNDYDHSESSLLSALVVFLTLVGFLQSGLSFASAWSKYVQQFGNLMIPSWMDFVQPIPTVIMSVPVQALMIRRCYYLVGKNLFIVIPLVLLLVVETVSSLWISVSVVHYFMTTIKEKGLNPLYQNISVSWLYLTNMLLPSILDVVLTGILLHHLTQTMKRVYAPHSRKRISRLANLVWQSALPPTICTICASVIYLEFTVAHKVDLVYWPTILQTALGKLYLLSLFYMLNAQSLGGPPRRVEQSTMFISTLTVPTEVLNARSFGVPEDDTSTCSEITAGRGPSRTVEFAV